MSFDEPSYLPGFEPETTGPNSAMDDLPSDVLESLKILYGGELSQGEVGIGDKEQDPISGAGFSLSAQKKFIEERSKKTFEHKVSGMQVKSFNLRSSEETAEYQEFMSKSMELALTEPTKYKLIEHPFQFTPNPVTGETQIIALVRFWKQDAIPAKKDPGYEVISGENKPERI